jgi:hypothetical protein
MSEQPINKEEWIERCYQKYLRMGIKNKHKARLWAESTFYRNDENLSLNPEDEAFKDLER